VYWLENFLLTLLHQKFSINKSQILKVMFGLWDVSCTLWSLDLTHGMNLLGEKNLTQYKTIWRKENVLLKIVQMMSLVGVRCLKASWKGVCIMTETKGGGWRGCWKRSRLYRKTLNEFIYISLIDSSLRFLKIYFFFFNKYFNL
jgi:hypothetical protein